MGNRIWSILIIGFISLLIIGQISLIFLKIYDMINISWAIVLLPLIIDLIINVIIGIILIINYLSFLLKLADEDEDGDEHNECFQ